MKPILIINFKTYKEATGSNALKLAKIAESISKKTKTQIIIAVQASDIFRIKQSSNIKIFSQHLDNIDYGSNTGFTLLQAVKQAGASGTVINHAEHKLPLKQVKEIIKKCKKAKFPVLACADSPKEVIELKKLKPNFIAYEPPELIGGDISVSTAKPKLITDSVKKAGKIPLLVGAGIKTTVDVKISVRLGAKGVFVASGIIKAKNKKKAILDLIKGFY